VNSVEDEMTAAGDVFRINCGSYIVQDRRQVGRQRLIEHCIVHLDLSDGDGIIENINGEAAGGNWWVNEGSIAISTEQCVSGALGNGVPGILFEGVLNDGINDYALVKQPGRIVDIFREVLSARFNDHVCALTVPLTGHGQS